MVLIILCSCLLVWTSLQSNTFLVSTIMSNVLCVLFFCPTCAHSCDVFYNHQAWQIASHKCHKNKVFLLCVFSCGFSNWISVKKICCKSHIEMVLFLHVLLSRVFSMHLVEQIPFHIRHRRNISFQCGF